MISEQIAEPVRCHRVSGIDPQHRFERRDLPLQITHSNRRYGAQRRAARSLRAIARPPLRAAAATSPCSSRRTIGTDKADRATSPPSYNAIPSTPIASPRLPLDLAVGMAAIPRRPIPIITLLAPLPSPSCHTGTASIWQRIYTHPRHPIVIVTPLPACRFAFADPPSRQPKILQHCRQPQSCWQHQRLPPPRITRETASSWQLVAPKLSVAYHVPH